MDIYSVGSQVLVAHLIASPQGDILLDGSLEENVSMIERNIDLLPLCQPVLAGDRKAFTDPQQLTLLVASASTDFINEVARKTRKAHKTPARQL